MVKQNFLSFFYINCTEMHLVIILNDLKYIISFQNIKIKLNLPLIIIYIMYGNKKKLIFLSYERLRFVR